MNNNYKHSIHAPQPNLGVSAYWPVLALCESQFNNNDRGTEIMSRVREGWNG